MSKKDSMLRRALLLAVATTVALPCAAVMLPAHAGPLPTVDPTVAAVRSVDSVVLTGDKFGTWSVPANVTAKAPLTDLKDCQTFDEKCAHNHYADPEFDSSRYAAPSGTAVTKL